MELGNEEYEFNENEGSTAINIPYSSSKPIAKTVYTGKPVRVQASGTALINSYLSNMTSSIPSPPSQRSVNSSAFNHSFIGNYIERKEAGKERDACNLHKSV